MAVIDHPCVTSRDGTAIGYRQEGSGPAVLLLHGIQRTGQVWAGAAAHLAARHTVLRPDLRGRGLSGAPVRPEDYQLERLADDLEAVVLAAAQPLDIVAWSMGVSVALAFTRRPAAQCVRRWVLVSGSPSSAGTAGWFRGPSLAEAEQEAIARAQAKGMQDTASPFAVAAAWLGAKPYDFLEDLPPLSGPLLIIHGDADPECPLEAAAALARRIPGARLKVLAGVGHNPMQDAPATVYKLLDEFLAPA
ncbi:alpha/beta fold hydrolase [Acidovorax sp. MR-S7]|uniref:alpha/beta fold hydrolase n=1 Tax=Acidovorax sp. MR-S7 TaxID=1268622 RepID=UPI000381E292|nr:alpha/beta hydrolase [Acidovorax sp. MR-S7]GAD24829.1 predicted hydrolases or acyltransferase [Acidovorax sp. MR-S7]